MTGKAASAADGSEDRSSHSVTEMILNVRQGDMLELSRLLQRLYADATYRMLMAAAYGKLGTTGAELDTPEAVVQEAMSELTKRARGGRLEGVDSRERLFGLLRLIVAEKARDFRRKALARGADRPRVSLDQPAPDGSQSGGLHGCLDDSTAASLEERVDVRDLLEKLLERIEAGSPDPDLYGKVFRGLLEGKSVSGIAMDTGKTRAQIDTIIEAIRGIAKCLRGDK
jgi:hypothetical protein